MLKSVMTLTLLILGVCLLFGTAEAARNSFGVRAGLSLDPDQFVIGAQSRLGELVSKVNIAPSVDLGFGDDVTTFVFNGDLLFDLRLPKSSTALYVGAGPTLGIYDYDGGSNTEVGLTAVGGLMVPMGSSNHYNLELRLGIGDIPEIRVLFGLFLGSRSIR